MARFSRIEHADSRVEGAILSTMYQRSIFAWRIAVRDAAGDPVDLSAWDISARAEYYTCSYEQVRKGKDITESVSDLARMDRPDKDLSVTIDDPPAGEASLHIPADLYEDDIPLDISSGLPLAAVCITYSRLAGDPPAAVWRDYSWLALVIRRSW